MVPPKFESNAFLFTRNGSTRRWLPITSATDGLILPIVPFPSLHQSPGRCYGHRLTTRVHALFFSICFDVVGIGIFRISLLWENDLGVAGLLWRRLNSICCL